MATGLVLEGGAFRGLFTAGVLDAMLDINLELKYVIGVSAGISNAYSYVSKQRGRNLEIMEKFMGDKRYISYSNMVRCGSIMDFDFVFNDIPNKYSVFDYDSFNKFDGRVLAGAFNIKSGRVEYFDKDKLDKKNTILRASCSIPILFPFVKIDDSYYADGGLLNPIPIYQSINDGNDKNIIVLTRNDDYRKKKSKSNELAGMIYKKKYPKLAEAILNRHTEYNKEIDFCNELGKNKKAIILRPTVSMNISRFERDKNKLRNIYNDGYDMVMKNKEKILSFI